MFVPNSTQLGEFDLDKAKQFVSYWGKLYSYDSVKGFNTEEKIDYIEELNIGKLLTMDNIKRLLCWKDPMMITEKILLEINILVSYLPKLYAEGFNPIKKWHGGNENKDGSISFPWPEYDEVVVDFF